MLNRRSFLKIGAVTFSALRASSSEALARELLQPASSGPMPHLVSLPERLAPIDTSPLPWHLKVRRIGQTNMTEHDPAVMDIEAWADYWHQAKADVVYISVTGILAYYPSKVPFHRHGKFLNGRDFFGDCLVAARKRNLRVVARMSPDLNWPDALSAHPEWAMRHKDGSPQLSTQDPRLFKTCMFTSYMDDYMPAIMREINSRYDVDCFYCNGWPPLGDLPECYCSVCSRLPPTGTPAYWRAFNDRVLGLWKRYDAIAKEKKPDSFFFANTGGNVRSGPNLDGLSRVTSWFQGDNQGRTADDPAVWGVTLQGRVLNAVNRGSLATNLNAAYSTGAVRWRNASKNAAESTMWMSETLAAGLVPYDHFIGAEAGRGEDRRWQSVGQDFFLWTAKHEPHWQNRRSLANIGVVIGQGTQLLYKGPPGVSRTYMRETTNGMYETLLRGRFGFDYVHEDRLDPESLRKYRVLLLPNIAMLSDQQCEQIRAYVAAGGSLMGSFETSLYDENSRKRADFGLADVFGISKRGEIVGTNGNAFYGRIERKHPITEGFGDTDWLPGAQNRVPLRAVPEPVLTVVPGFVQYPPELAYPPESHTDEPAVVLREQGASRCAFFPGDVERTYWLTGHGDLLQLLHNTLRWLTRDESLVSVQGEGLVEVLAWETTPGYAIHLLNYTNPNAFHGWISAEQQIGPQEVAMMLPNGARVSSVDLLRSERRVPLHVSAQVLRFTVPDLRGYDVAAITLT